MEIIINGEVYRRIHTGDYGYFVNKNGDGYVLAYVDLAGRQRKDRPIKKAIDADGYARLSITKNGQSCTILTHRAVAIAFLPNPENKKTVNHKNGIKSDCRLDNLEWATQKENIRHAYNTGLVKTKLTEFDVKNIIHLAKNKIHRVGEIAKFYDLDQSSVSKIVSRQRWARLEIA